MACKPSLRLSILAMLVLLAGCSSTKPVCVISEPPADIMQPPVVVDFLTPLQSLILEQQPKGKPSN